MLNSTLKSIEFLHDKFPTNSCRNVTFLAWKENSRSRKRPSSLLERKNCSTLLLYHGFETNVSSRNAKNSYYRRFVLQRPQRRVPPPPWLVHPTTAIFPCFRERRTSLFPPSKRSAVGILSRWK